MARRHEATDEGLGIMDSPYTYGAVSYDGLDESRHLPTVPPEYSQATVPDAVPPATESALAKVYQLPVMRHFERTHNGIDYLIPQYEDGSLGEPKPVTARVVPSAVPPTRPTEVADFSFSYARSGNRHGLQISDASQEDLHRVARFLSDKLSIDELPGRPALSSGRVNTVAGTTASNVDVASAPSEKAQRAVLFGPKVARLAVGAALLVGVSYMTDNVGNMAMGYAKHISSLGIKHDTAHWSKNPFIFFEDASKFWQDLP